MNREEIVLDEEFTRRVQTALVVARALRSVHRTLAAADVRDLLVQREQRRNGAAQSLLAKFTDEGVPIPASVLESALLFCPHSQYHHPNCRCEVRHD